MRQEQNNADFKDRKEMVKPHFGPEEPEPEIFYDKKAQEVNDVKTNLLQQIQDRKEVKSYRLQIKKIQDERAKMRNEMLIQQDQEALTNHDIA